MIPLRNIRDVYCVDELVVYYTDINKHESMHIDGLSWKV